MSGGCDGTGPRFFHGCVAAVGYYHDTNDDDDNHEQRDASNNGIQQQDTSNTKNVIQRAADAVRNAVAEGNKRHQLAICHAKCNGKQQRLQLHSAMLQTELRVLEDTRKAAEGISRVWHRIQTTVGAVLVVKNISAAGELSASPAVTLHVDAVLFGRPLRWEMKISKKEQQLDIAAMGTLAASDAKAIVNQDASSASVKTNLIGSG